MSKDKTVYNPGKLALALVEHLVEPVLGKQFIKEARKPQVEKELRASLVEAFSNAEQEFIKESTNKVLAKALLNLPLNDSYRIQQAVRDFCDRSHSSDLAIMLEDRLVENRPDISKEQITDAVAEFIRILRAELVSVDSGIRDKIVANAILEINWRLSVLPVFPPEDQDLLVSKLPPLPDFSTFTGREEALADLRTRIGVFGDHGAKRLTIMQGWPGVGKTTLSTVLAYQTDVKRTFPDGILWTALGDRPNLMSTARSWGHALGAGDLVNASRDLNEAIGHLETALSEKKVLIIVDDVYELEHGKPFRDIGGSKCKALFTTRFTGVATNLAEVPERDIYVLSRLSDEHALELLRKLAREAVEQYPEESLALVVALEGLPLAIQVAGRMLYAEEKANLNVAALLEELKESTMIMEQKPPASRIGLANETNLTIAALFEKSTDCLSPKGRECFAFLGGFAPKPASFDIEDMKAAWQLDSPEPIVRELMGRGLLEYDASIDRYRMHALLVMHAKHLLGD